MVSKLENGYEYVDLNENIDKSNTTSDSISIWLWFLIVFTFAAIILLSLWYYKIFPSKNTITIKNI